MTTFIKTKFKISDLESPSNQSKRRKKIFKLVHKKGNWTFVVKTIIWGKYDIRFGIPIEFPSQRKKIFKSVHIQGNWILVVQIVIWGKFNFRFWIPIKFPIQRRKKLFKSVQKQRNYALTKNAKFVMFKWTFVVQRVILGEYNIGFGIPITFPSQRKIIIEIGQETTRLCFN